MENDYQNCPFCNPEVERIHLIETESAYAIFDKFPVSKGHTLIIPKVHESDYFKLPFKIQSECWLVVNRVKEVLQKDFNPDGFNVGVNIGESAGQTVFHVHIHLIPRYNGDVEDPKGGVRGVISDKKIYSPFRNFTS